MADYYDKFTGIVMFHRKHKEKDALVKIYTRDHGKRMFFVRNFASPKNPLRAALLPFSQVEFIGRINKTGLSFLHDFGELENCRPAIEDIEANAYASYITNLVDAAIEDTMINDSLFELYQSAIDAITRGLDPALITNIFEIQVLPFFGVDPNFQQCVLCGSRAEPFAYSFKYHGVLCQKHWSHDDYAVRHLPRAVHYVKIFQMTDLTILESFNLTDQTKGQIRMFIDLLFEDYVGLNLKSKSFIDQLNNDLKPLG